MKKNQKIYNSNIQMCGFPMHYMNITQGNNGSYSHQGVNALDLAGKDLGIDDVYAPCDMKLKYRDSATNGNALFFESVNKIKFADGTIDYCTIMIIHDNYVDDVVSKGMAGHIFLQGEIIAQEGMAGRASGNHTHFEIAKGKYSHPYDRNNLGVYHLPNSVSADKCCFTNGTIILNGNGMKWKDYIGWTYSSSKNKWWWDNGDETYPHDCFKEINGKIYYFDHSGWMAEGWKYIDNQWYYFELHHGQKITGWKQIDSKWYFLDNDGTLHYGWLEDNGKDYFLNGKGEMVVGNYRIDGKDYKFNNDGSLIK